MMSKYYTQLKRKTPLGEILRMINKAYLLTKEDPFILFKLARKKVIFLYRNYRMKHASREIFEQMDHQKKPLVSVIMTTYNSQDDVAGAINSLLEQTYEKIELIIVDDQSSDKTVSILRSLAQDNKQIKILQNHFNRGPYWCKNYGIMHASGQFITFQDSDDTSKPDRIEQQLRSLYLFEKAVGAVVYYERVTPNGKVIKSPNGTTKRLLTTATMYRRHVFDDIGYYDSIRFGADSEFFRRCEAYYANRVAPIVYINKVLYIALTREVGLTSKEAKIDFEKGTLADERVIHLSRYKEFHESCRENKELLYHAFPLRKRHIELPIKMTRTIDNDFGVIAWVDCRDQRESDIENFIGEVLKNVDKLYIFIDPKQNNLNLWNNKKIITDDSTDKQDLSEELWQRFLAHFKEESHNIYYLSLKSSLTDPENYIAQMIVKIQSHADQVAFVIGQPMSAALDEDQLLSATHKMTFDLMSIHSSQVPSLFSTGRSVPIYDIERSANWIASSK